AVKKPGPSGHAVHSRKNLIVQICQSRGQFREQGRERNAVNHYGLLCQLPLCRKASGEVFLAARACEQTSCVAHLRFLNYKCRKSQKTKFARKCKVKLKERQALVSYSCRSKRWRKRWGKSPLIRVDPGFQGVGRDGLQIAEE